MNVVLKVSCEERLSGHPRMPAKESAVKSPDVKESRPKPSSHNCNVCGKPSQQTICDPCAMKVRLDALARKTHEENGNAWAKWESPDASHKHRH
jgi:hypothetical protein